MPRGKDHPAGPKAARKPDRGPLDARDQRILIVRVGALGDVLHALAAVAALREARPRDWIGWAIEPRWRALLESSEARTTGRDAHRPLVDRVYPVNVALWRQHGLSRATAADVLELIRRLRSTHFDCAIDLQGSIRSSIIGRLAGANCFAGNAAPREIPARFLYGQKIPVGARHVVEQACELLGAVTALPLRPASILLPQDTGADIWATGWIADAQSTVLLAPTAGWGAKQWPPDRFAAVALALARAGHRVLVNAPSATDAIALRVTRESAGIAEPVACSLEQLVALVRRCRLLIAGDTGPLHLAAALGIPALGLYGPTDPARTGPWSSAAVVLRDPASVTDHRRHRTTEAGLLKIHADQVVSAALEMLGGE